MKYTIFDKIIPQTIRIVRVVLIVGKSFGLGIKYVYARRIMVDMYFSKADLGSHSISIHSPFIVVLYLFRRADQRNGIIFTDELMLCLFCTFFPIIG